MVRHGFAFLVSLILLAGCGGSSSTSSSSARHPCDPLAANAQPVSLHTIVGIGKDSNGTLYVVDQVDFGTFQVFVSSQGGLYRQRIAGSGQTSNLYVFSVTDHTPQFTLEVSIENGKTRMGVVTGPFNGKSFTIGQQGEELTVVGKDAIAGMPLHNLPGNIVVEYAEQLPDQRVMVVTRPQDDWTYQDFRLFLGPLDKVLERRVDNVARGNSTTILFELDGSQATAFFPLTFTSTGAVEGQATLTVDGKTSNLTKLTDAPPGASYHCF